jgi:hypothetical protein
MICEFEKRFHDFKNHELKFAMFSGRFTFDVEKADEELQMELINIRCDSVLKRFVRLVYQIFTVSSPGINSQNLLRICVPNMCNVW